MNCWRWIRVCFMIEDRQRRRCYIGDWDLPRTTGNGGILDGGTIEHNDEE